MNKQMWGKRHKRSASPIRRNLVKLPRCILLLFCFLLTAVTGFAQTQTNKTPSAASQRSVPPLVPKVPTQETDQSIDDGKSDSPYFKGRARFLTLRRGIKETATAGTKSGSAFANLPAPTKPPKEEERDGEDNHHMPFWQGSFNFLGVSFPFRMIGTDPAKGSATTRVPVTIIPVQFTFSDGAQLSASQNACGDTQSPVSRILKSPLFENLSFTAGSTFLGKTQYIDAFQRANFWSNVSTTSPDYHILLSPTLASTASLGVPAPPIGFNVQGPCALVGFEDISNFDLQVRNLIETMNVPTDTLPVFIIYNTFLTQNGGCCILGYHSVTFNTERHPYVVASYSDPNLFFKPIEDIHALSHELGEWLDDPFVRSFVPAWGNVGQVQGSCSFALETGDAVTGTAFELTTNGFTYHPEDLVFLSWFARQTLSSSVNGQYTFLNSFAKPPEICGQ